MPAKNSIFLETQDSEVICGFALNPLRTRTRGPAIVLPPIQDVGVEIGSDNESYDAVDEIVSLFRANVFFRNFEIQGPADRVLMYGILYVSQLLLLIKPTMTKREAEKAVYSSTLDVNFSLPGDPRFPIPISEGQTADSRDTERLRQYMSQIRQEIGVRLLARVYQDNESKPSKWWLSFTKRKFTNKSL